MSILYLLLFVLQHVIWTLYINSCVIVCVPLCVWDGYYYFLLSLRQIDDMWSSVIVYNSSQLYVEAKHSVYKPSSILMKCVLLNTSLLACACISIIKRWDYGIWGEILKCNSELYYSCRYFSSLKNGDLKFCVCVQTHTMEYY